MHVWHVRTNTKMWENVTSRWQYEHSLFFFSMKIRFVAIVLSNNVKTVCSVWVSDEYWFIKCKIEWWWYDSCWEVTLWSLLYGYFFNKQERQNPQQKIKWPNHSKLSSRHATITIDYLQLVRFSRCSAKFNTENKQLAARAYQSLDSRRIRAITQI